MTADQSSILENTDPVLGRSAAATETPTAQKDARLSTMFELAEILVMQPRLESMLSEILSSLIETLEAAEAGVVLLYDPDQVCLNVVAARGYNNESMMRLCLAPGESRCGKAFQSSETKVFTSAESIIEAREDLTPENRVLVESANASFGQATSAVCIPLVTGQTRVGVLMLENRKHLELFSSPDVVFLQAVADLVAFSIQNARLKEELQATKALEEANRLKAELISTLAHEMRTPLTSIKGYSTALLMEEVIFDLQDQREFLQIIDEECDILQDLIHDLLESSVIDAGLLRLELQPVRLTRVVEEVIADIERRTDKHRIVVDFPVGFPILDADPDRIVQVLRNLLDNAVKYSPQGGLIVVRGEVGREEVVVSVADQGAGIAPEHLNRLFEKFFRIDSGLGRHVVGSGLGLPIALAIVESHGGRIWAESQLGEGSTFFFTLPLEVPDSVQVGEGEGKNE